MSMDTYDGFENAQSLIGHLLREYLIGKRVYVGDQQGTIIGVWDVMSYHDEVNFAYTVERDDGIVEQRSCSQSIYIKFVEDEQCEQ